MDYITHEACNSNVYNQYTVRGVEPCRYCHELNGKSLTTCNSKWGWQHRYGRCGPIIASGSQ